MSAVRTSSDPFSQQKPIPGIKNVVVVASGKGGVGKSSVAVNLAVAMAKKNKVGLLDADIYGPSVPRMMGAQGHRPLADDNGKIQPIHRYNVKVMSIGFLIDDSTSVVWRGPMLFKAIDQFLKDVDWGELDYLIVDLPPGTGDIQLTLAQRIPITGAIIVSTPQNISLVDAKKAIDMFERVQVPILGLIENMSYMINPSTKERIQLFPKGEIDQYLSLKHILKIGEIPFNPVISSSCELGVPLLSSYASKQRLVSQEQENFQVEVQEFNDICEHIELLLSENKTSSHSNPTESLSTEPSVAEDPPGGCSGHCTCR